MVASLAVEHRLWGTRAAVPVACGLCSCGPWALEHRLSCSVAHGIFLHQGSNPCLLHWQADSFPLDHQGSPGDLNRSWLILQGHLWRQSPRRGISLQKANEITDSLLMNQFRERETQGSLAVSSVSVSLWIVAESPLYNSPSSRMWTAWRVLCFRSFFPPWPLAPLPAQLVLFSLGKGEGNDGW